MQPTKAGTSKQRLLKPHNEVPPLSLSSNPEIANGALAKYFQDSLRGSTNGGSCEPGEAA